MTKWAYEWMDADAKGKTCRLEGKSVELKEQSFAPPAPPMLVSKAFAAQKLMFVELPVGWVGDWHASPQTQWVICLAGIMGYELGDGSTFELRAGDMLFSNDAQSLGHKSSNLGNVPIRLALVQQ